MAYCDYEFYKRQFFGSVIAESDFPKYAENASDRIDTLTSRRIKQTGSFLIRTDFDIRLEEWVEAKVKKAVCAIAELLYDADQTDSVKRAAGGAGIKSVSSGSESISFSDQKNMDTEIYMIAKRYLTETGLLYGGIR